MERINATPEWRLTHVNVTVEMTLSTNCNLENVYSVIEHEANASKQMRQNALKKLFLQDLHGALSTSSDRTIKFQSALDFEIFCKLIPAAMKELASAFPQEDFTAHIIYDDLRCYLVNEYFFSFNHGTLTSHRILRDEDNGYFCPKCYDMIFTWDESRNLPKDTKVSCDCGYHEYTLDELVYYPAEEEVIIVKIR